MAFTPAAEAAIVRMNETRPADFDGNGYETKFPQSLNDFGLVVGEVGGQLVAVQQASVAATDAAKAAAASQVAAKGSQDASAASAKQASDKATESASSATAAGTAKTDAEGARDTTLGYRNAAAQSKTDADAAKTAAAASQVAAKLSQDAAKGSQDAAAGSATAADGSKTAAAGSATAADTSAKASAQSAASSETARAAAVVARGGAETARDAASQSKSAAAASEGAASSALQGAQTARDEAQTARGQAVAAATVAGQAAAGAEDARDEAAQSASVAGGARGDAIAAKDAAAGYTAAASGYKDAAQAAQAAAEAARDQAEAIVGTPSADITTFRAAGTIQATNVQAAIEELAYDLSQINVTWNGISGKPATFPPSAHTHPQAEIVGLVAALSGKAASEHKHPLPRATSVPGNNTIPTDAHGSVLDLAVGSASNRTIFLPLGSSLPSGWWIIARSSGDGGMVLDANGSTIEGGSSFLISGGRSAFVLWTGSGFSLVPMWAPAPIQTEVGGFVFARHTGGTTVTAGTVVAGSQLQYSNGAGTSTGSTSGTWRCCGYSVPGSNSSTSTLWQKVT